jgi:aminoglycoside/choline kinase family phosphotransferase
VNSIRGLQQWLDEQFVRLSLPGVECWHPQSGDAGQRQYFRSVPESTLLAVFAPPSSEDSKRFVELARFFRASGMHVPRVLAQDFERGFLLIEDLGTDTLWSRLQADNRDGFYAQALSTLLGLQHVEAQQQFPLYSAEVLSEEFSRFQHWFVEGLLGLQLSRQDIAMLDTLDARLVDSALSQAQVVVHRDFHSRNLVVGAEGNLGLIDFQDALFGPITYDLVSLLKDCYIDWPPYQIQDWALTYLALLKNSGISHASPAQFMRDFHWMGLQRHLKVLGVFSRLYLRDGKANYLEDIPRVMQYIDDVILHDHAFSEFSQWWHENLVPAFENFQLNRS